MPRNDSIQVRRDTAANWTSVNPTLASGEIGFETDTGKFKIGTGSTAWTSLLYATDASDITGTITGGSASTVQVNIQVRRDTAANWTSTNPTLASGEMGLETDTNLFKIGDGSTAWSALLYQTAKITTVTKTATATLALTDAGKVVEMNVATNHNLTIPPNSGIGLVPFPIGTQILVIQVGAGQTTLVAGAGVTLNAKSGNLKITGQWSAVTLIKRATDTWVAIGDLSA